MNATKVAETSPALVGALNTLLDRPTDRPTSAALEEATRVASEMMEDAHEECVRAIANVLFKNSTGFAKPEGKMVDGIWEPAPAQYFPTVAWHLAGDLAQDRKENGVSFHAKKRCKSWSYCVSLARAYLDDVPNLPAYVAVAVQKANLEKVRNDLATKAAERAARVIKKHAEEAAKDSPEFKAKAAQAKREAKLDAVAQRIAGLEDTLKQYEKKMKRARTLLKKARAEQKRLSKTRGA